MRGIFRFSFSSHQINQFYEQQIGELRSDAQISCLLPRSLSLSFVTTPVCLKFQRFWINAIKRKMNARFTCDMDTHKYHPLIVSTKICVHELINSEIFILIFALRPKEKWIASKYSWNTEHWNFTQLPTAYLESDYEMNSCAARPLRLEF